MGADRKEPWPDRWREARNWLIADRRFQRLASAFPPTRPIGRRRGRALFDICAGFVYSQVLLACVRLDLFAALADGPASVEALARRASLPPDAMLRLLRAATALGLVESRGGDRFGLASQGAAFAANPGLSLMVEHHALLYDDLRDPVALLRGDAQATGIGELWPYAGRDHGETRASADGESDPGKARTTGYTALMSATQRLIADEVLAAYTFSTHERLMDVGGGDGAFLSAVAARATRLDLVLFDLPSVADQARLRFATDGLDVRAQAIGGDMFAGPLPAGADAISLIRILHDHDDEPALRLLRAARAALPRRGSLVIAEPLAQMRGAEPVGDAYFGFYLLAMGSGRPRSAAELTAMALNAGFAKAREMRTRNGFLTGVIIATA